MKVLVADDNRVSRLVLERILRNLGYDPVLTENGRSALTSIVTRPA